MGTVLVQLVLHSHPCPLYKFLDADLLDKFTQPHVPDIKTLGHTLIGEDYSIGMFLVQSTSVWNKSPL